MKFIPFSILIIILNTACSYHKQDVKCFDFSYQDYITATKKMPFLNNETYYKYKKQLFIYDTVCYLAIFDLPNQKLAIFDITYFNLVYQSTNVFVDGRINAVDIHNFDSIFLLYNNGILLQTDTSFLLVNEWIIDPISNEYGESYRLESPLKIFNNNIYVGHYPNLPVITKERLSEYFSKHSIIKLSFENTKSIVNYYGRFPHFYQNHCYNTKPCWFEIEGQNIITSFWETDSIYVNNRPVASVHSIFFTKNKERDIKKINDEEYCVKITTENCKYGPFLYNPYTKHYYRMFHFAINYDNKDGTVNYPDDAKKSIIVTDENFNVLKEVVLPPEYFIYDSYVTPKGLMIKRENKNDKKNIYFDFFNL